MTRKRIGRHLEGGHIPEEERARRDAGDALRDVYSRWATGVSIVAVRDEGRVHALTVSALMPLSVEPPLLLIALGPNASVLPFLERGGRFGVSVLQAGQRALASRFADVFPAGPDPFPAEGPPIVRSCLAALVCEVDEVTVAGDHHLVTGRVKEAWVNGDVDAGALVYYLRAYHPLGGGAP